jgi:hypothetical protein
MALKYLNIQMAAESYAQEIDATLPRILALADRDPLSVTLGMADRQYWSWKLIDFPNATFQGHVNGLACLYASNLLGDKISSQAVVERIQESFRAVRTITRRNGSLEEAFPYERSYCVTALIAYDLLRAAEDMARVSSLFLDQNDVEETVGPLIGFLKKADETHGIISNHLATAVAALYRWELMAGDKAARQKGDALLSRIYDHRSQEGWFKEYEGADPGYQTLCLTYLVDVLATAPTARLEEVLQQAVEFISHFVHPDGSFGGLYGSRGTRIYYPAGIETLAADNQLAAAVASALRRAIADHRTVPLSAVDQPNLMPVFNSYCRALQARQNASHKATESNLPVLPCETAVPFRRHFTEAGLLVDGGAKHYTVISSSKGGVVAHWRGRQQTIDDPGVALESSRGKIFTSQTSRPENLAELDETRGTITITAELRKMEQPLPDPYRFVALRVLNVSVMRMPFVGELIKRMLVRMLITAKRKKIGTVTRTINLGADLYVKQVVSSDCELREVKTQRSFSVIHMASQGYWQVGDSGERLEGRS